MTKTILQFFEFGSLELICYLVLGIWCLTVYFLSLHLGMGKLYFLLAYFSGQMVSC